MEKNKIVEVLNEFFRKDPNAIHSLICSRVPCNKSLADDEFVLVSKVENLKGDHYQIGVLGLINGVLAANGLPLIAVQFSEEKDEHGRATLLGFCNYSIEKQGE